MNLTTDHQALLEVDPIFGFFKTSLELQNVFVPPGRPNRKSYS